MELAVRRRHPAARAGQAPTLRGGRGRAARPLRASAADVHLTRRGAARAASRERRPGAAPPGRRRPPRHVRRRDLGGRSTSPAPLVSFDLSAVYGTAALPILMACVGAWFQGVLAGDDRTKRIVVLDEAWAVLSNLETAQLAARPRTSWPAATGSSTSPCSTASPTWPPRAAPTRPRSGSPAGSSPTPRRSSSTASPPPRWRTPASCSTSTTPRPG